MIGASADNTAINRQKALGSLWGLLVGDCLGSPIQFTGKDDHPHVTEMVACKGFGTPPGYWTDDGSMALCIAESVARLGRFDRADVGNNFVRWLRDGFLSSLPHAFDVGGDADSIGAVCGQLAGAKYGVGAIPERWLAAIKDRAKLSDLFDRFLAALDNAPALS